MKENQADGILIMEVFGWKNRVKSSSVCGYSDTSCIYDKTRILLKHGFAIYFTPSTNAKTENSQTILMKIK